MQTLPTARTAHQNLTQQAANRWAKELHIRNSNKLLLFHKNAAIRIADLLPCSWTNTVFSLTRDLCWPLLPTAPFLFSPDSRQTSSLSCPQAAGIDAFDRSNWTNNQLCVHKAVLAGTPVDLKADLACSQLFYRHKYWRRKQWNKQLLLCQSNSYRTCTFRSKRRVWFVNNFFVDTGIVHSSNWTSNYFCVDQLVAEGIVLDQNTALGLFETVLSTQGSSTEANKTNDCFYVDQTTVEHVRFDLNAECGLLAVLWST